MTLLSFTYKENDKDIARVIFTHLFQLCSYIFLLTWNLVAVNRFRVINWYSHVFACVHAHAEEHKITEIFLKSQEKQLKNNVKEIMHPYSKSRG